MATRYAGEFKPHERVSESACAMSAFNDVYHAIWRPRIWQGIRLDPNTGAAWRIGRLFVLAAYGTALLISPSQRTSQPISVAPQHA